MKKLGLKFFHHQAPSLFYKFCLVACSAHVGKAIGGYKDDGEKV